jgi:medium-chain acyl-[acyl-carrier-protein] hydrolase
MMSTLETKFHVASYECDFSGRLSLSALCQHFQEIAGINAEQLGVGYRMLKEEHLAWMLSRIIIRVNRRPRWGDDVVITTWPKGISSLFALRDFRLEDSKGDILVLGTSAWLLVDVLRRRPRKIESLPVDLRYPGAPHAIDEIPGKLAGGRPGVAVYERTILPGDIDLNNHVNNTEYIRWVTDCFSPDLFRSNEIRSLQLNYLEETLLGDILTITLDGIAEPGGACRISGLSRNKGGGVFQANVEWSNRAGGNT